GEWRYRRCSRCGLLTSEPLPSPGQIEEHYRRKFRRGNYELVRRYAPEYLRIHAQIADWMNTKAGDRVLDIGCFTGDLLEVLAARGADVHGVELQEEAVAIANTRLPGRVFQADVFGNAFPPGPYEAIAMMGLIEHVLDPRSLIKRSAQLMTAEGRLFIQTPDAGSAIARLLRGLWPPLAPIEHIHLFSARSIT